jgi:hypothetical protein
MALEDILTSFYLTHYAKVGIGPFSDFLQVSYFSSFSL